MRVKYENGTLYKEDSKVYYQDAELFKVNNYNQLLNKEVIFKKMGERSDYIIQPKGMLKRGTYCVTELYST